MEAEAAKRRGLASTGARARQSGAPGEADIGTGDAGPHSDRDPGPSTVSSGQAFSARSHLTPVVRAARAMKQNPQRKVAACMATVMGGGSLQEDVPGGGVPGSLLLQETRQQTGGALSSAAASHGAHTQTSAVSQDSRPHSSAQSTAAPQRAQCQPEATGGLEA